MGIDHRADQHWNGLPANDGVTSPQTADQHTPDATAPPKDHTGEVVSSTPFKTGHQGLPSLSESPVPSSRRSEPVTASRTNFRTHFSGRIHTRELSSLVRFNNSTFYRTMFGFQMNSGTRSWTDCSTLGTSFVLVRTKHCWREYDLK